MAKKEGELQRMLKVVQQSVELAARGARVDLVEGGSRSDSTTHS
jgi:hypothetical protein